LRPSVGLSRAGDASRSTCFIQDQGFKIVAPHWIGGVHESSDTGEHRPPALSATSYDDICERRIAGAVEIGKAASQLAAFFANGEFSFFGQSAAISGPISLLS
jgi:hypothetical protein